MSKNLASIVAAIGGSGSGKSAWIKGQLAATKPKRLLIWDPQDEYGEHGQVFTDRTKLFDAVATARTFQAVYRPGEQVSRYPAAFDSLCRLAYGLGTLRLVIEELADVTEPSRAPDGWSIVTRKGRHKGLSVVAASQRPASVDKDFFGNCTLIHCGRLVYAADLKTMAGVLCVDAEKIQSLAPCAYIERDMTSGATREGKLDFAPLPP